MLRLLTVCNTTVHFLLLRHHSNNSKVNAEHLNACLILRMESQNCLITPDLSQVDDMKNQRTKPHCGCGESTRNKYQKHVIARFCATININSCQIGMFIRRI